MTIQEDIDLEAIRAATLASLSLQGLDPALLAHHAPKCVEISLNSLLQILSHVSLTDTPVVSGQLLGVDALGTLSITSTFGFVTTDSPEDYQRSRLLQARQLNQEAHILGWYQSTPLSSFWSHALVETQYQYQSDSPSSILLLLDPSSTVGSKLSLCALRLSKSFMDLYANQKFTIASLQASKLGPKDIFESLPIKVEKTFMLQPLLSSLKEETSLLPATLKSLAQPKASFSPFQELTIPSISIPETFGFSEYIERHIDYLGDCADEYAQEQWRHQGWTRFLAKEQARLSSKAENTSDIVPPSLAKVIASEPSKLETLLILNQMETYCSQLDTLIGS